MYGPVDFFLCNLLQIVNPCKENSDPKLLVLGNYYPTALSNRIVACSGCSVSDLTSKVTPMSEEMTSEVGWVYW